MYILFDHGDIDTERLEQYEVYGSWNNWKKSIKLEDYAFSIIVESTHACIIVYVYKINDESYDSNTIQYKLKYRNSAEGTFGDKYILIHNILTIHDNGFDNNKIIKQSSGHYFTAGTILNDTIYIKKNNLNTHYKNLSISANVNLSSINSN